MKQGLKSRLLGEISTSNMQMTWFMWQNMKRTKEPLDESERGEWKRWLKTQHSKWRSWHSVPIFHGKYMGKQWKQWETLFWGALKSLQMVNLAMKLKCAFSLEENLWRCSFCSLPMSMSEAFLTFLHFNKTFKKKEERKKEKLWPG